ncbi:alpha/beta hydrolase [Endozoicomonas sp. Mp262]|uniref:esterase/lipase family protein n=1 Tax=Endozoicomonas sp. Mp262 TaxID=2919499 RepID=UPI0021DA8A20
MNNNKKPGVIHVAADIVRAVSDIRSGNEWKKELENIQHGDGHPVLVFPGFMTSDRATAILRKRLVAMGYDARPWDQGINLGQTREGDMLHKITDLLKHTYIASSRKVSLIGWSLGGLMAREAARTHPEQIRNVISMGSPIGGSPRHSSIWKLYEVIARITGRQENIDELMEQIVQPVEGVHCISIYSDNDGVIPPSIAREQETPLTENIKVDASHLGLPFSAEVLKIVGDRLAQPDGDWKPFQPAST